MYRETKKTNESNCSNVMIMNKRKDWDMLERNVCLNSFANKAKVLLNQGKLRTRLTLAYLATLTWP